MTQGNNHTPGPWVAQEWECGDTKKDQILEAIRTGGPGCGLPLYVIGSDDGTRGIATVDPLYHHVRLPQEEEANARLIAAAPQLYQIAKVIEAAYIGGPSNDFHTRLNDLAGSASGSFADLLIDAIAKAEVVA